MVSKIGGTFVIVSNMLRCKLLSNQVHHTLTIRKLTYCFNGCLQFKYDFTLVDVGDRGRESVFAASNTCRALEDGSLTLSLRERANSLEKVVSKYLMHCLAIRIRRSQNTPNQLRISSTFRKTKSKHLIRLRSRVILLQSWYVIWPAER